MAEELSREELRAIKEKFDFGSMRTMLEFEATGKTPPELKEGCTAEFTEDGEVDEVVPDVRNLPRKGGAGFNPAWLALSGVNKKRNKWGQDEDDPKFDANATDLDHLPMEQALVEYQQRVTAKRIKEEEDRKEMEKRVKEQRKAAKLKELEQERVEDTQQMEKYLSLTDHQLLAHILLELRRLNNRRATEKVE